MDLELKKPNAVTYEEVLTLPTHREFLHHTYKPGYDNHNGDKKYFGTSDKGMRIIKVNTNYAGGTHVTIYADGGTRTVYSGFVRSFEDLKLINFLTL